jgi:pyruvate dehydrogenase E1 component beta subunit/2-oxoisovalerate dehydrogenase E1 component beta subunit
VKAEKLPESNGQTAGKARIARPGRDLTVVSYSATVHDALLAAQELARTGIQIEVVDLRTVKPLDTETVLASVTNTGRLLCVGESWPWGGVNAEIIARVAAKGFQLLDSPPERMNSRDVPVPYHPELWRASRPSVTKIVEKVRKMLQW